MGRLSGFSHRDAAKRLRRLGLSFDRQAAGSHEIWYNPATNRYTKLTSRPGDLPDGTLRAILKQARVEPDELLRAR